MALNRPPQILVTETSVQSSECDGSEDIEPEETEKLELEVKQMAQKILEYRVTLPDQLKITLASVLSAQRPAFTDIGSGFDPGPSGDRNPGDGESGKRVLRAEEDKEAAGKIQLLRHKISSNVSTMPILLKRMNDCISKIDNLDKHNGIIHPAFKKKRNS